MSEETPGKAEVGRQDDVPPFWPPPPGWQPGVESQGPTPEVRRRHSARWIIIVGGIAFLALLVGLRVHNSGSSGCPLAGGGVDWSPNGKTIAFNRNDSTGSHIYALNLATRHVRRLTDSQCDNEAGPSWSPNGRWLVYERSTGEPGVYLMRTNGGGARRIIADASEPAWAPDGKRLAYTVKGKLYIAPVDDPEQAVSLPTGRYLADNPTWSPDGKWIAFAADTPRDYFGDNAGVGVVSARGSRVRLIDPGSEASGATWSPDSKWIAYEVYSKLGPSEIRIASRAGTSDRLLLNVPEGNAVPAWSPSGATIAIYWSPVGNESRKMVIYLVRRNGRDLKRIYSADVANKR